MQNGRFAGGKERESINILGCWWLNPVASDKTNLFVVSFIIRK